MLVLDRIAEEALRLIPQADGSVVELADGEELVCVSSAGSGAGATGARLRIDGSLAGLALRTGSTLRSDDTARDPRIDPVVSRRVNAVSVVSVPLRRGNESVGGLTVISSSPAAFDDRDVATLTGLAEFITTTITASSELSKITDELFTARHAGTTTGSAAPDADAMSRFVANVLHPGVADDIEASQLIERILADQWFVMLFQPVVDLRSGELVGVEALARFLPGPYRPPDAWFAEAHRVGRGVELEHAAVRAALSHSDELPPDCFIAVNVGALAIASPEMPRVLDRFDARRVVLELTEHLKADDAPQLRRALATLRERGVHLAIDDVGSGFSGLSLIVRLAPDIIKVDMELVRGIDFDPVRRSLVGAVVTVAGEIGATVVAEGIETEGELETLRQLNVDFGQGYLPGRPGPPGILDSFRTRVGGRFRLTRSRR